MRKYLVALIDLFYPPEEGDPPLSNWQIFWFYLIVGGDNYYWCDGDVKKPQVHNT